MNNFKNNLPILSDKDADTLHFAKVLSGRKGSANKKPLSISDEGN
jgi:hypothetical protein